MRILHTADWHLGKILKGQDRTSEIASALRELLVLVRSEKIDLVLVAGDLFDRKIVSPEAESASFEFFLGLRELNVPALVIAGNHDSRERLEALSPLLSLAGATVFGDYRFAEDGGVVKLAGAKTAMLPFISERRMIRAENLMGGDSAEWKKSYGEKMGKMFANLASRFVLGESNILMAHLTVDGSRLGGGEFLFHTTNTYAVDAAAFPESAQYVALGHIHRQQQVSETPVGWYSGSLIQLDFGDSEDADRGALIVELSTGKAPLVTPVKERWGRPLRSFRMAVEDLDRRFREIEEFSGLKKIILSGQGSRGLRERLFREIPDLLEVEFALPEAEVQSFTAKTVEDWDWITAYREYRLEATGEEPSEELLEAFTSVFESETKA